VGGEARRPHEETDRVTTVREQLGRWISASKNGGSGGRVLVVGHAALRSDMARFWPAAQDETFTFILVIR
jgi:hypothetical protein